MAASHTITLPELAGHLATLAHKIPFGPLIKAIRLDLIGETKKNFFEGHGPDGETWAPLKWARSNSKGADKPLRNRGILAAAVTSAFSKGNVSEETPDSFLWGTNLEYAGTHQYGATITPKRGKFLAIPATREAEQKGSPRAWGDGELKFRFGKKGGVAIDLAGTVQFYFSRQVTIPARPFLGINEAMTERWQEMTADYVADWAQGALAQGFGGV